MANLNFGEKNRDIRLKATIWIWGLSIVLLLACVPALVFTEQGVLLPLAVVVATAISTAFIWIFGNLKSVDNDLELQNLKTRVSNLEIISDVIDFDKKLINEK
ncbi:hypothetical protein [Limnoraphis robusta]|uniref:Uncharacterized protein n=1 Tax=Limnoraphis robusta CCNP1315 TaxID=3110306 RepID=A0ABU5U7Z3_9CYAN|nr:hypothetical protein [Limnoraphis robusta]MEA5523325.1 hypothetical protein [Limnoraphis robusta CCNP1315]MEA5547621.1 hypothetical protein [Limnoraphis robusta CCNP1324]